MSSTDTGRGHLKRFAWLSIGAAVATILLKFLAWWLTGSVGLLSDALESMVNLVAAAMTLWMLGLAARPPTAEHAFGYSKAEYFSSGIEGAMILVAALAIGWAAAGRLLDPQPLESVGLERDRAIPPRGCQQRPGDDQVHAAGDDRQDQAEADAHHLMTDVWTSAGVVVAVGAVAATGWTRLDPAVALAVAANIVFTGYSLIKRSAQGLLDRALGDEQLRAIDAALQPHRDAGIVFHALRTRAAAGRSFVSLHVLVPGAWTVQRAHDLAERIEQDIAVAVPGATAFTHVEPLEDPLSYADTSLERSEGAP